MLKISTASKKPVKFELDDQGKTSKLQAVQFRMGDSARLAELQKPLFSESGEFTATGIELNISRVITSVKTADGKGYYWESIEDFKDADYPLEMLNALTEVVNDLNPLETEKVADKKK